MGVKHISAPSKQCCLLCYDHAAESGSLAVQHIQAEMEGDNDRGIAMLCVNQGEPQCAGGGIGLV